MTRLGLLVAIGLEDSWMFQVSSIRIIRGKVMGLLAREQLLAIVTEELM